MGAVLAIDVGTFATRLGVDISDGVPLVLGAHARERYDSSRESTEFVEIVEVCDSST